MSFFTKMQYGTGGLPYHINTDKTLVELPVLYEGTDPEFGYLNLLLRKNYVPIPPPIITVIYSEEFFLAEDNRV